MGLGLKNEGGNPQGKRNSSFGDDERIPEGRGIRTAENLCGKFISSAINRKILEKGVCD